ncbi:MAG: quinolinate synthase NadA [Proteobacteria bacterium]|nr:quinolinate synthase NadA [Desulfobulbaceae bacterium]MBU4153668.1 quinolinate synthase NadA [Pseudomonadota bacterium]
MQPVNQVDIGPEYREEREEVLAARIAAKKRELGDDLLILCHHYQQDAIFTFAHETGDSLKLAKKAAEADGKRFIVFCGVHFMAESADILTSDRQVVILPDLTAGCSMADMASRQGVEEAWQELASVTDTKLITPVTYVNSSARLKAFVGEQGGSVCTSSNAERVLTWALGRGEKVFFFPDEHLGRNSAHALGIPAEEIVLWRREEPLGGNTAEALRKAKVILWDGYCTVHMQFSEAQIRTLRQEDPKVKVIVHPECRQEVVLAADQYGSTEMIIRAVADSPVGSSWAVGTEVNLVKRLAQQYPDKKIRSVSPVECLCSTMYRIDPAHLLWTLDHLAAGRVVNQITVDEATALQAKKALDRMLTI